MPGRVALFTREFNFALFEVPSFPSLSIIPVSTPCSFVLFTARHSATPISRVLVCVRSLFLSLFSRDIITIYQTRIISLFHESSMTATSTE